LCVIKTALYSLRRVLMYYGMIRHCRRALGGLTARQPADTAACAAASGGRALWPPSEKYDVTWSHQKFDSINRCVFRPNWNKIR